MKQPEDRSTLERPGLDAPKRGRGRPRKPDALTPAQRAKRYRDKQRKKAAMKQPLYRCPRTGSTWNGKGQKPRWVVIHLQDGGYLADLHNPKHPAHHRDPRTFNYILGRWESIDAKP